MNFLETILLPVSVYHIMMSLSLLLETIVRLTGDSFPVRISES